MQFLFSKKRNCTDNVEYNKKQLLKTTSERIDSSKRKEALYDRGKSESD